MSGFFLQAEKIKNKINKTTLKNLQITNHKTSSPRIIIHPHHTTPPKKKRYNKPSIPTIITGHHRSSLAFTRCQKLRARCHKEQRRRDVMMAVKWLESAASSNGGKTRWGHTRRAGTHQKKPGYKFTTWARLTVIKKIVDINNI